MKAPHAALLVHLSDLHILRDAARQALVLDKLVEALAREREASSAERIVVAITGDVFDSATDPVPALIDTFLRLHGRLVAALGGDAPTIVLPGNHDRRRLGLLGPHREQLFRALNEAVDPRRVFVAGCRTPFLAQIVPAHLHGLPAHVITYDSSYLPHGLVGAGGTIRIEDLLQAHAGLPVDGRPVVVLIHHHLIPTPVTDTSHIDSVGTPRLTRWLVGQALPALVSNADREELTMTALGAGTALSTLHAFGRAVLLLHGHKHVPTARLVRGMTRHCGDVLLASAGSAGHRERLESRRSPRRRSPLAFVQLRRAVRGPRTHRIGLVLPQTIRSVLPSAAVSPRPGASDRNGSSSTGASCPTILRRGSRSTRRSSPSRPRPTPRAGTSLASAASSSERAPTCASTSTSFTPFPPCPACAVRALGGGSGVASSSSSAA